MARQEDPQVKRNVTKIAIGGGGAETNRRRNDLIQTSTARNRRTVLVGRMYRSGVVAAGNILMKSEEDMNFGDSEQPG